MKPVGAGKTKKVDVKTQRHYIADRQGHFVLTGIAPNAYAGLSLRTDASYATRGDLNPRLKLRKNHEKAHAVFLAHYNKKIREGILIIDYLLIILI